jgi:hypothetical protein
LILLACEWIQKPRWRKESDGLAGWVGPGRKPGPRKRAALKTALGLFLAGAVFKVDYQESHVVLDLMTQGPVSPY